MPVEVIIKKIKDQEKIILDAMKEKEQLLEELQNVNKKDYDWISVSEAARLSNVSLPVIYRMINSGRLHKLRHIGSKKFVSLKELAEINDKPKL